MTWCRDMPSLQESDNPKGPTCWATSWHNASRQKPVASFKAAVTAVSTAVEPWLQWFDQIRPRFC
jgi:hypothetical protein